MTSCASARSRIERMPPTMREMLLAGKRSLSVAQCSATKAQAVAALSRLAVASASTNGASWVRTAPDSVNSSVRARAAGSRKRASDRSTRSRSCGLAAASNVATRRSCRATSPSVAAAVSAGADRLASTLAGSWMNRSSSARHRAWASRSYASTAAVLSSIPRSAAVRSSSSSGRTSSPSRRRAGSMSAPMRPDSSTRASSSTMRSSTLSAPTMRSHTDRSSSWAKPSTMAALCHSGESAADQRDTEKHQHAHEPRYECGQRLLTVLTIVVRVDADDCPLRRGTCALEFINQHFGVFFIHHAQHRRAGSFDLFITRGLQKVANQRRLEFFIVTV